MMWPGSTFLHNLEHKDTKEFCFSYIFIQLFKLSSYNHTFVATASYVQYAETPDNTM